MRILLAVAASGAMLGACAVSTEGGPLWDDHALVGEAPKLHCVTVLEVSLSGNQPSLEQVARRAMLEVWQPARDDCPAELPARRLEIRDVAIGLPVDAFALPPAGSEVPGPARMRVSVSGRFREVGCLSGETRDRLIERSTWIPWVADPWLREEKAAAAIRDLVPRLMHLWAAEEAPSACPMPDPATMPNAAAPATMPAADHESTVDTP
jgi:hypothetical protein